MNSWLQHLLILANVNPNIVLGSEVVPVNTNMNTFIK